MTIKKSVAFYIESKGMIETADKFAEQVYDTFNHWQMIVNLIVYAGNR
jgi:hypothetical protein